MDDVNISNSPVNEPGPLLDEVQVAVDYWRAKNSPSLDSIRARYGITWPRMLRIANRNKEAALAVLADEAKEEQDK